ncbi:hypothetical protein EBA29_03612 [Bacillus velezensis]|uniref:Uncharacterized protein n=1 Tax=Bacillus amyloliquefaciens (strain Y2) TaxID=1155777 RepID=I2CB83_BACAY|nr:hypothetical protein MUS_4058 [Bacillus velezensis YAU B9601-Y2]ERH54790.1 hypothetical protein O205_10705 [Bacillus amyloliquefaciens EGD-AQ14]QAR58603.1 hypothetical protein EBA29_03612 [Bacillus velezensis]RUS05126.1 hypothetical protein EFW58_02852 [Bacillus velezensis]
MSGFFEQAVLRTKKAFCKGLTACFAVSRNYITFSSGDR